MEPRIQYAKTSDGVNIAYAVFGEGKPLVYPPSMYGLGLHLYSELPMSRRLVDDLTAQGFQVVRYDGRGAGSSDRDNPDFSVEAQVSDLEAVIEHLGFESAVLVGAIWGTEAAAAYAVRHPERVSHLVLRDPRASVAEALTMYPAWKAVYAMQPLAAENWELISLNVAVLGFGIANLDLAGDLAKALRSGLTPGAWVAADEALDSLDAHGILESIQVPTLVVVDEAPLVRTPASTIPVKGIAAEIPGAELVSTADFASAVSDFVFGTGALAPAAVETGGSTAPHGTAIILFADIADSTALTERLGDAAFRAQARDLDTTLRTIIRDNAGTPIEGKLLGDGVLATFASARQAIGAALACGKAGDEGGLPLHLGLHAGDVIREENNVFGGAVNVAARISGLSAPGEVLVSDIVRGLARTSAGVAFEDRGERELKGVGEPVRVWAVADPP
jgi:class 3 adenylate cyclase